MGDELDPNFGVAELDDWSDLPITLLIAAIPGSRLYPGIGDTHESEIVSETLFRACIIVGYPNYSINASWFSDSEMDLTLDPKWHLAKLIRIPLTSTARVPILVPASTLYIVYSECDYLMDENTFQSGDFSVKFHWDSSGYPIPNSLIQKFPHESYEFPILNQYTHDDIIIPVKIFREWSVGDPLVVLGSETHLQTLQEFPCVQSYLGLQSPTDELVVELLKDVH